MINLLPPDRAMQIRYGRRNAVLRWWIVAAVAAVAGLIAILVVGGLYMDQQSKDLSRDIANSKDLLKSQNLTQVEKDAEAISGDIKVINQVLSQELSFSELLQAIGKTMPPRTVLTSLSLTSNVNGSVDLNAGTIDAPSAAQIAVNLRDPEKDLFSKVDIVTVSCSNESKTQYKCNATYRALFSKSAQTRFINVPKGNTP